MSDRIKALLLGFTVGTAIILGVYTLKPNPKPAIPQSNFAVVDTYKGCDVVRWALPSHAEYKYLLHCEK